MSLTKGTLYGGRVDEADFSGAEEACKRPFSRRHCRYAGGRKNADRGIDSFHREQSGKDSAGVK